MKKFFYAIALVLAMTFSACGNTTNSTDNSNDSTAVDTVLVDTVAVDTVVVDSTACDPGCPC